MICPFCPSGALLSACRCQDAQYSRVVGFPTAKAAFLRRGGILRHQRDETLAAMERNPSALVRTPASALQAEIAAAEPAPLRVDEVPACSFCGKPEHEPGYLVKGPHGAGICNDCVVLAAQACAEHGHPLPLVAPTDVFKLNEDGTAPVVQPEGICPSCDKRRAYKKGK